MISKNDPAYQYWKNMMSGIIFKKGESDSKTKHKVLAVRKGHNIFGPDTCYFDYVDNLPFGVLYVDCESFQYYQ